MTQKSSSSEYGIHNNHRELRTRKSDLSTTQSLRANTRERGANKMASTSSTALLMEAPAGRHFAQLHKDPQVLADAVGVFVETGLIRNEAVIVIAPLASVPSYLQRLEGTGKSAQVWQKSGQLTVLDGPVLLSRVMKDDMPQWDEFRESIGQVLESGGAHNWKGIRVYGEMVNDLWRAGHTAAAIRLEEYWNELARVYQFCLFCGYHVDSMNEASYADPLHEIGRTHTDILATQEDDHLWEALNRAAKEVLGIPLSQMLIYSGCQGHSGAQQLSRGYQAMLWIKRNVPEAMNSIVMRTREIYADETNPKGLLPQRLRVSTS